MSKDDDSTIENRVYLFKDLAAAWLSANPNAFTADRQGAMRTLADLAYASCVVADTCDETPDQVRDKVRRA